MSDATSLDLYRQLVAAKDDEIARLGEQLAVKDEQLRQANLLIAELSRRVGAGPLPAGPAAGLPASPFGHPSDRGVSIHTVAPAPPACVLRYAPHADERVLVLSGVNFPLASHGLQFRRFAPDELSLIFDMEVNWISDTRISVDLAHITDLLWPDRRLALCARLMDTTNANYQALSNWSPVFIVADDAARCGLAADAPGPGASAPDQHAGRRRGRRWWQLWRS